MKNYNNYTTKIKCNDKNEIGNDILFFKVWRNIVIRRTISKFLKQSFCELFSNLIKIYIENYQKNKNQFFYYFQNLYSLPPHWEIVYSNLQHPLIFLFGNCYKFNEQPLKLDYKKNLKVANKENNKQTKFNKNFKNKKSNFKNNQINIKPILH